MPYPLNLTESIKEEEEGGRELLSKEGREGGVVNLFGAKTVKNYESTLQKKRSSCKVEAYRRHGRLKEPDISRFFCLRTAILPILLLSLIFMQIALKVLPTCESHFHPVT